MTAPRIREVSDDKEMAKLVDDFFTQGFTIKEQGIESTLLKKKTWGSAGGWIVSLVLAALLFWTFIGLLIPVVYAIYAHYTAPEVLIRTVQA